MVWVALFKITHRNTVIRGNYLFRRPIELVEVPPHRFGKRLDVGRIVVVGWCCSDRRLPAHLHERFERLVVHGGGGRGSVLGIEREPKDAIATDILQALKLLLD